MGAFGENYPYTNFHDLNLDWVIGEMKKFIEQYTHLEELVGQGEEELESKTAEMVEILQQKLTLDIAEFNRSADVKTAQSIASIPADYTELSNRVNEALASLIHYDIQNATVPTATVATRTNVELDMSRSHYLTITNTDSSAGYFRPHAYRGDTIINTYPNVLLNPGESHTWKILGMNDVDNGPFAWSSGQPYTNFTFYVGFTNTNGKTATFTMYSFTKDEPLKDNVIFVDKIGANGAFQDLISAIAYAKVKVDVNNVAVTIRVRQGTYTLLNVASSQAVITKGANKISIIGDSPENTIIKLNNVYPANNKIIDIGGDCVIENMAFYNYSDVTTPAGATNPYCIHNDSLYVTDSPYATVVRNCICYSEMANPIGAGLRDKQKQIYDNVKCISTKNSNANQGALYVHSQGDSNENPSGLEIVNCLLVSQNNTICISLPSVHTGDYQNIPVRFLKNTGWTNAPNPHYLSPVNFKFSPDTDLNGFTGATIYEYNLP